MKRNLLIEIKRPLSTVGLFIGLLSFAVSLTPSMLPRTYFTQGVLSGCALGVGYCLGVFFRWVWRYMEARELGGRALRIAQRAALGTGVLLALLPLWRVADWQNSIRELMGLELLTSALPFKIVLLALATAAALLLLGRLFRLFCIFAAGCVKRHVPRRVANVIGVAAAAALFWSVINGVVFRQLLHAANASYRQFDELMEPELARPSDPMKTGSSASLVKWEDLGRAGRAYVASGPGVAELRRFSGDKAVEPVRVYVGIRSRDTVEERAKLAVEELKRAGGFDRSILIVITPTGTGWVDPSGIDSVEYLHNGDVASVAMQYSYLASALSLFIEPEYGADASRALYAEVFKYWTTLPKETRPRLYLFGLSLGALHSAQSVELNQLLSDPPQGALWSGPPFMSKTWSGATAMRDPSSPVWLPRVHGGRLVRFMNQNSSAVPEDAPWGPARVVYLQYASDPITFFQYDVFWKKPLWMSEPRGPDLSPKFRWYPVVTFLQLALDIVTATSAPAGYGHVFAPEHYFAAWLGVTGDAGHSPEEIEHLRAYLSHYRNERGM